MGILNATKIIELRRQKGWTQVDLARAANVDQSVISRLERETQQNFSVTAIAAIALALNTTIDDLLLTEKTNLEEGELIEEMWVLLARLRKMPQDVQKLAAGMLRGMLSVLEDD